MAKRRPRRRALLSLLRLARSPARGLKRFDQLFDLPHLDRAIGRVIRAVGPSAASAGRRRRCRRSARHSKTCNESELAQSRDSTAHPRQQARRIRVCWVHVIGELVDGACLAILARSVFFASIASSQPFDPTQWRTWNRPTPTCCSSRRRHAARARDRPTAALRSNLTRQITLPPPFSSAKVRALRKKLEKVKAMEGQHDLGKVRVWARRA